MVGDRLRISSFGFGRFARGQDSYEGGTELQVYDNIGGQTVKGVNNLSHLLGPADLVASGNSLDLGLVLTLVLGGMGQRGAQSTGCQSKGGKGSGQSNSEARVPVGGRRTGLGDGESALLGENCGLTCLTMNSNAMAKMGGHGSDGVDGKVSRAGKMAVGEKGCRQAGRSEKHRDGMKRAPSLVVGQVAHCLEPDRSTCGVMTGGRESVSKGLGDGGLTRGQRVDDGELARQPTTGQYRNSLS